MVSMDELIPLTDFDKRLFPDISPEEKINFILHSNSFERIVMKYEDIESQLLFPTKVKPAVKGQQRALDWIIELASNPDLLPPASLITPANFDKKFNWFTYLHRNLLFDFAKEGEKLLNAIDYPSISELGFYRTDDKKVGDRLMPPPDQIKPLLAQAFKEFCAVHDKYKDNLSNPRMLELQDWKILERAARNLCLRICCIKPFNDGSNRIARLVENLVRLNTGLRFKIITDKNDFLKEVQELQDRDYKFT